MRTTSYFCHIVIPSRDQKKSKRFYEKVFGWKVSKQPGSDSLDILPPAEKGPSAELNPHETVITPTIYTSDIEATLDSIVRYGGKILVPATPVGGEGGHEQYALFTDPEGNKLCLYSEEGLDKP